jgi:hypothetical protein
MGRATWPGVQDWGGGRWMRQGKQAPLSTTANFMASCAEGEPWNRPVQIKLTVPYSSLSPPPPPQHP